MNTNTDEIIKQLNRLANDRSLNPSARRQILDAVRHIRDMQLRLSELRRETTV